MFDINLIKVGFTLITLPILILGSLVNACENYMPTVVKQSIRYGKFAYQGRSRSASVIELPKSSFKHFYIFSSSYATLSLIVSFNVYVLGGSVPLGFLQLLDLTTGTSRRATVGATASLIALVLLTLQCYRRLFETHFVSVFASSSRINIAHYLIGYAHYAGAIGAILAEAPVFASSGGNRMFSFGDVGVLEVVGTCSFMWAWVHQYRAAVILANLRKSKQGSVVTYDHKLPRGDWFEYVSSPHLLAEILMYTSLTIILRGNTTWYYALAWVVVNQTECAFLTHRWYKETFKNYPTQRKAIVPFLV